MNAFLVAVIQFSVMVLSSRKDRLQKEYIGSYLHTGKFTVRADADYMHIEFVTNNSITQS